jgi:hypothetical protein
MKLQFWNSSRIQINNLIFETTIFSAITLYFPKAHDNVYYIKISESLNMNIWKRVWNEMLKKGEKRSCDNDRKLHT